MKKLALITAFTITLLGQAFAQTPTPNPSKDDDVVKISTDLIQIDVVVTDKKGNIINDLRPEDFEVYENDELVKIAGATLVGAKSNIGDVAISTESSMILGGQKLPPKPSQVRRTVAIVIDDSRLSLIGVTNLKKALTKFVNEQVGSDDLIAIIKTSGSVGILQQFTTDKTRLLSSIEKIQWNPITSIGTSAFAPIEVTFSEMISSNIGATLSTLSEASRKEGGGDEDKPSDFLNQSNETISPVLENSVTTRGDVQKITDNFRSENLASGTFRVLNRTIREMDNLPGRKSIIFAVEGIDNVLQGEFTTTQTGMPAAANQNVVDPFVIKRLSPEAQKLLKSTIELANRSAISIYPLDPRGVAVTSRTAEDSTRGGMFNSKTNEQVDLATREKQDSFTRSLATMKVLAAETGGKAFVNDNSISDGLSEMLNSQKGYYLLAYQPDSDTFDAEKRRFNKLTVKVKRPDVRVTYRSGFFNIADDPRRKKDLSYDKLFVERLLSPYRYDDINLRMASVFAGGEKSFSTIRSFLDIKPSDLMFIEQNGKKIAKFDLIAMAFNENGIPIARMGRSFSISVDANQLDKLLKTGIPYNLSFNTRETGIHTVKAAIRDVNSKRVGTIFQEIKIPDFNKQNLSVSGLLMQNLTVDEWKALQDGSVQKVKFDSTQKTQNDTAYRRFPKGTILNYSYVVYATTDGKSPTPLTLMGTTILLKDGKEIFKDSPESIQIPSAQGLQKISKQGAFMLGTEMLPGTYTLQVNVAPMGSNNLEIQTLGFEIVN